MMIPGNTAVDLYRSPPVAAALGLVRIVGRTPYFCGYVARPKKRFPGFVIQSSAALALLFGALGRVIYLAATT